MSSPLTALLAVVSAALDRSRGFFERRPAARSLGAALVVVAALSVAFTLGIYGLGIVFDATVDETVTVDNPDHTPEWVCENHDEDSVFADGCDEPERIEVDAGAQLRDAMMSFLHYGPGSVLVWWVLFGVALHVGALAVDGEGSIVDTFVVAAWALVPEVIRFAVGLAAVGYALDGAELRGDSFEALTSDAVAAMEATTDPLLVASAVTIAVQWWIVVGGLEAIHGVRRRKAVAAATVLAVLGFLLALA